MRILKNCDEMVQHVLHERGLNPQDCNVLCGFDGGQGLLKIGFPIAEKESLGRETIRSKYPEVSLCIYLAWTEALHFILVL